MTVAELDRPVETEAPDGRTWGTFVDGPGDGPLYRPARSELQLTFRALAIGCSIGGVVSAMNLYFGLQTGWSIGGSLIAAILGYSLFALCYRGDRPFTPLETNIAQTAGSAAGAMTSCAGLLSAVPAMQMLGHQFTATQLVLWAASVAWLGVFFAVPLRRQMVLVEKLRFPSGTATASTIAAIYSSGAEAIRKSRTLIRFALAAAAFTVAAFFVPELQQVPLEKAAPAGALAVALGWLATHSFQLYLSPVMVGAGLLIGMRVAASLAFGAVVAWGLLAPFVEAQGWAPGATMSYKDGARGWILWPGVAIMVADALTSLALSWRTFLRAFTVKKGAAEGADDTSNEPVPNSWWIGGLAAATGLTSVSAWLLFGIPWPMTVLAVALSSILATIAVRSTGETDINPVGGMGKVTQLVFGALSPGQAGTNLMTAAITGAGATQAGDMMHDLKTGYLLGASPRKQVLAQLVGIAAGIVVCVPVYMLFSSAYEIGGDRMPAPAAHAWRAMAELLVQGLGALPPHALGAVAAGALFGMAMPLLRRNERLAPYVPSALAVGIAFIVQAYFSLAMFAGAVVHEVWKKRSPEQAAALAFAVASGLIAGEGLMGVVTAGLKLMGLGPITGGH